MNNVIRFLKGLFKDRSFQDQPENTTRFVLNGVNRTREGDQGFIANEEGNQLCADFPANLIPLGKEYIGNGEEIIFLCSKDESYNEIGIIKDCVYTPHVRTQLNFKLANQIDATYRLRKGCERTVYWVDGDANKPRYFNFDKPEDFKSNGDWDEDKFNLFKIYSSVPRIDTIELEELGTLPPGGYNFSIQYLDEDLNPTEFIWTSDVIQIYNDSYTKSFSEIRGSTNLKSDYQDFGNTNKSIKLTLSDIDQDFPFYRLAICEATSGNGQISRVVYTAPIPKQVNIFSYTGSNFEVEGTEEEVKTFNNIIDRAEHIEQIENRLILSNTKGKQIEFCNLQKYASKIKSDLILKNIVLNNINVTSNQKRGTALYEGVGYMPGEIYSFGIVYVFKDGTVSPVYHIPGANELDTTQMSLDNTLENTFYIEDASSCNNLTYWGKDFAGETLSGKKVRHHRFPRRGEINEPLFEKDSSITTVKQYLLTLDISGAIDPGYTDDTITYQVSYTINGNDYTFEGTILVANYSPGAGLTVIITNSSNSISYNSTTEIQPNGDPVISPSGLIYNGIVTSEDIEIEDGLYTTNIMGIEFSNIELPNIEDSSGEEIIGYYIVRNERTQENKTILDNGVAGMLGNEAYYMSYATLIKGPLDVIPPSSGFTFSNLSLDTFYLIHPEFCFNNQDGRGTTTFIQEGAYTVENMFFTNRIIEDVMPGTSYDPEVAKKREADADGFDLHCAVRYNSLSYSMVTPTEYFNSSNINDLFYLDALSSRAITNSLGQKKEVFNVSSDNKIGIVSLNTAKTINDLDFLKDSIPYLVMKRDLSDPYANFRILPYYKDSHNFEYFNTEIESTRLFAGDSYVSPMKYVNSFYYDTRLRKRDTKSGIWNIVIGVVAIIAAAVATVFSFGTASALLPMALSFGIGQIATGISKQKLRKTYLEAYEAGLKDTLTDPLFSSDLFFGLNPEDDQIQWAGEALADLWIESSVNMNWRQGLTIGIPDFMNAPTENEVNLLADNLVDKLIVLDTEAANGALYKGFAAAEIYQVNPDYMRGNKQKVFYHLPLEYDCCSDCQEYFPHRNHYSEQSFQEESIDNYRIFLPNNYRDIEGETGIITDTFRIQNNLYIHTEEGLWHLPQNIQERITGDIISFIGTGDFFAIPPRKVVDDETGNSAGTRHKWGTIKTPHGVFFVSEGQSTFFQFNGNSLTPISSKGLLSWFKENTKVSFDKSFRLDNGREYLYKNNPSNPIGTGFISVYDSRYERIIFTKVDFELDPKYIDLDDYHLVQYQDNIILFADFNTVLYQRQLAGWSYIGVVDGELKFVKIDEFGERISEYVPGEVIEKVSDINSSWTISYSLESESWTSWHSYLPGFYYNTPDKFYSWNKNHSGFWEHNIKGLYQSYYGEKKQFIVEYVSLKDPLKNKLWDYITLLTEARKYMSNTDSYKDERLVTFNKAVFYNSVQCSGLLNIKVKDENLERNYLEEQTDNVEGQIIADRNERDWTINDIRDYRVDYDVPIWIENKLDLQDDYYIDKVLNELSIDSDKFWGDLQSFRDKYLVIRLIFDKFDDVNLILNYSIEEGPESIR